MARRGGGSMSGLMMLQSCCGALVAAAMVFALLLGYGGRAAASAAPSTTVSHLRGGSSSTKSIAEQGLRTAMEESLKRPATLVLREDIVLSEPLSQFWGNLTVRGACAGRKCAIDGGRRFSIFDGLNSAPECALVLDNLVLRNAKGSAVTGKCDLKATRCAFRNNTGGLGAAVSLWLGPAKWDIQDCVFEDNVCLSQGDQSGGGAIFACSNGRGRVARSVFRRNRAPNGYGGAICINGRGAVRGQDSYVFDRVTFDSNSAKHDGGAFYMMSYFENPTWKVFFRDSTFKKNSVSSGYGGALALYGVMDVRLCRSALAGGGNSAPRGRGGDIAVVSPDFRPSVDFQFCPSKPRNLSLYVPKILASVVSLREGCQTC